MKEEKGGEGGGEGRCSGLTNSLICPNERKSSVLCCRVPEEGESVITQRERRGGRGRKRERCQGVTIRAKGQRTDRESEDVTSEEKKSKERKKKQQTEGQGQADSCSLNIFTPLDLLDLLLHTLQDCPCASCQSWSTVSCLCAHV